MRNLVIILLLLSAPCHAASVALKWDANPIEDEVKHYDVCWSNYSGNTRTFAFSNCSSTTATTKTVTGISPLQKWYFRVNATNESTTSLWSNKVYLNFVRTPAAVKFQTIDVR